jgi:metallo-beta-lactamase class B
LGRAHHPNEASLAFSNQTTSERKHHAKNHRKNAHACDHDSFPHRRRNFDAADIPANITEEDLAKDNKLFLTVASKGLKWEEAAEPIKIAGPLYFVGTKGLSSFLFVTGEGNILFNTGMPSSGPMIEESIRQLGFKFEEIKVIINGHAHSDHAGAIAYLKEKTGAQLAVMREDVTAMEDGGKDDFYYGWDWKVMGFPPAKVDRILRDGDTIRMGDVLLTAHHTPGHTRGATTWVANIVDNGKALRLAAKDDSRKVIRKEGPKPAGSKFSD